MGEINYGASFFEWFAEQAKRINGEVLQSPFKDKMLMYTREPIGPVGIIVPVIVVCEPNQRAYAMHCSGTSRTP